MFRDKLVLVMLVLGLLTIVAAAGVFTIQRGNGRQENPYVDMQGQEEFLAGNPGTAGASNAGMEEDGAGADGQEGTKIAGNPDGLADEPGSALAGAGGTGNTGAAAGDGAGSAEMAAGGADTGSGAAGNVLAAGEDRAAGVAGSGGTELAGTEESGASGAAGDGAFGEEAREAGTGLDAAHALVLDFADTGKLSWPVRGNVLLDYSMDSTIYFPTLDQYKCNPGLVIQGEISDPVYAPANARVLETGTDEEIGNYLTLDLGNGYQATCGQLKEVSAVPGEYLESGQLLGYVAEPTKYYSVEGSNIYFGLSRDGKAADPLDYLE